MGKKAEESKGTEPPSGGSVAAGGGRFSARRKAETVLRLLRGESLETVSREAGVTAATLSEWRDDFMAAGEAGLKTRAPSLQDDQIKDLKAKIGELTMDLAIQAEFIKLRGLRPPFAKRSSA